jgi:hypothetical protein
MFCLGSGLLTSPYQLGAYSSIGDTFMKCILPEHVTDLAENYTRMPLIRIGGRYAVHNRQTQMLENCAELAVVLHAFLEFLEKTRQRVRPAYDGVMLLSFNPDATPALLQQLERCNLSGRFWRTVAGLGHLTQYIKEACWNRDEFQSHASRDVSLEMISMEDAYMCAFKKRIGSENMFCDLKSNYCYQILLQLLQQEPTYQNFFRVSLVYALKSRPKNYSTSEVPVCKNEHVKIRNNMHGTCILIFLALHKN